MLASWKDTLLVVVAFIFGLAGIWGWELPIDEAGAMNLVELLYQVALLIAGIIGGGAGFRYALKRRLAKRNTISEASIKQL